MKAPPPFKPPPPYRPYYYCRWSGKLELMEQRVLAGLGKNIAEFTLQVRTPHVFHFSNYRTYLLIFLLKSNVIRKIYIFFISPLYTVQMLPAFHQCCGSGSGILDLVPF
jgi:hypothetical protein